MRNSARVLLLATAVVAAALPAGPARAGATTEAKNPADVYERNRTSLKDIVIHVVKDLKVRAEAWGGRTPPAVTPNSPAGTASPAPAGPGATFVLVVDPTSSMKDELIELREALIDAIAEGPRDLKVGVLGAAAEWTPPGHVGDARGALTVLATVPFDGAKNLLEAVRQAATALRAPATEPRAILLVTKEGGDAEDDVETTRDLLKERGVAFYSVAREAAFERPWDYDFVAKTVPDLELTQRWNPTTRHSAKGEMFYGGDVGFGLVPYLWELKDAPLAQAEFSWGRGRFPVPSGFGYWPLASLSWTTGGRCFVYNFRAPGARSKEQDRLLELYDLGFLNLFAPDLRPRAELLRAMSQDKRATTIVKIWEYCAEEEAPLVLDHGTVERAGQSLVARPMLPVRSATAFETSYALESQVTKAKAVALERQRRAEQALSWWTDVAKREVTPSGATIDPLTRRVEANFDLLGAQLLKVRFHWGEIRAALETIKPEMVDGDHRTGLVPVTIAVGYTQTRAGGTLEGDAREAGFIDLLATLQRIAKKYHGTPWSLIVEKGYVSTILTRTIDTRPRPEPPQPKGAEPPKQRPMPPRVPEAKPAPPPPPERPGSGSGSSTTNK